MFIELPTASDYGSDGKPISIRIDQIMTIEEHPFLKDCSLLEFVRESQYVAVKIKYSDLKNILKEKFSWIEVEDQ